ncbi:hypothetical protein DY000_02006501 [Brassica cretica]|uniref:Uncharacterized protein n=1 Tax=Brassica cretica TaxID=69181 RepID=A0ABQ7BTE2_BRACR|nr:hypothetical protein DY000_02006501 [Brassica cretica]
MTEGKSLYLKGHTSWIRSPETPDPGQPTEKVARPQWHAHEKKNQNREQSKSCFSRRGKQRKPGTWVITPTPAPSKHAPVVVLPRKVEYGLCEKTKYFGLPRNPGPLACPRSQEETQGSPHDFGVPKIKKEARTPVQPRAHQGHYNFKNLRVPVKRSPDLNLWVLIQPQRSKYYFRKRIEPMCSLNRIGVTTSLKNLRVPMRPQGPNTNIRVPIRSPDLKENPAFSFDLRVQLQSQKPSGSNTISGSIIESLDSYTASGLKSRSYDLEKRPSDLQNDFRRTSGLLHSPRPLGP